MPVKDRMGDLKQRMQLLDDDQEHGKMTRTEKGDAEGGTLQGYLRGAGQIEGDLLRMKGDVAELKRLQLNLLSTPFQDRAGVARFDSLGERLYMDAARIGASMKQLHKGYGAKRRGREAPSKGEKGDNDDEGGAFKRLREQQMGVLAAELRSLTDEFFGVRADYFEKMKARLRCQLLAKGESVDDLKIGALAAAGEEAPYAVFTDNYLSDARDAEQALRDAEDRHRDVLALEKSISDMNQLFKEVSLMIADQGEVLDRVEDNIEDAEERLESAVEQLGEAGQLKRKLCRTKCWIIAVVVVTLVVAVVVVSVLLMSE